MPTVRLGINAVLKYGNAGTTAGTVVPNTRDIKLNMSDSELDGTSRSSGGFEEMVQGNRALSIDFEIVNKATDTSYDALLAAYWSRTPKAFLLVDAASGGNGVDFDGIVTKWEESLPYNGVKTISVSIKPTPSSRAPVQVVPSGGS